MKKLIIVFLTVISLITIGILGYGFTNSQDIPKILMGSKTKNRYVVNKGNQDIETFRDKQEALEYAKNKNRSIVKDTVEDKWIYSNLSPFMIITKEVIHDFEEYEDAVAYAKRNGYEKVYFRDDKKVVWEKEKQLKTYVLMNIPLLQQFPHLQRGCEVTSLAMIFKHYGENVSNLKLAEEIKKDNTPYSIDEKGRINYGNPYEGFVGNMYDLNQNGYGVYHGPIYELANNYFKDCAIDITGCEFEDLLQFLSDEVPVWVVVNSTYKALEERYFEIWHTPTGIVKITKKMHSVVITGYDDKWLYINDPLKPIKNMKVNKNEFKKAWEQMGNQGIVILGN